ncbi:Abi family protein [Mesorhizobium sp. LMG17149]|uniref:Abi family protein n=1 Tax=Mesorhizobium sp. LMG17149 TaxID=2968497 RepID=UPI00211776EB|nr:Abi family protein [Mesorhizobium sp. LMG17149]MCQ8872246.1 Abi family protein [Mesorhizobium sp. LMG17149]
MQETFEKNPDFATLFKKSLSASRFGTYLSASASDEKSAIQLYQWNAKISQSLYIYLQAWEICLRNKMNDFFIWKYKEGWPYDQQKIVRNLKGDDRRRLTETIQRQERDKGVRPVSTSAIVADLTAGFWVSQLSGNYNHHSWRYNLVKVFAHETKLDQATAWAICNELLTLRNRIAHHEPVFQLPLNDRRDSLARIVSAMCPATSAFAEATCNFASIWSERPKPK